MTPGRARMVLYRFMGDVCHGSVEVLEVTYAEVLNELGDKLSGAKLDEEDVNRYLNQTLEYIANLNKYFKKQGGYLMPYAKVFHFANKDERLSEFLFDVNVKKKKMKPSGEELEIAGFSDEAQKESDAIESVVFKDEMYTLIHRTKISGFYFSPVTRKVIVKTSKKKLVVYSLYASMCKKKGNRYIYPMDLYRACKKKTDCDVCKMFCEFFEIGSSSK